MHLCSNIPFFFEFKVGFTALLEHVLFPVIILQNVRQNFLPSFNCHVLGTIFKGFSVKGKNL